MINGRWVLAAAAISVGTLGALSSEVNSTCSREEFVVHIRNPFGDLYDQEVIGEAVDLVNQGGQNYLAFHRVLRKVKDIWVLDESQIKIGLKEIRREMNTGCIEHQR